MSFSDDQVQRLRRQVLSLENQSIHSKFTYLEGKYYHFEETHIYKERIKLLLPKEFIDMPPNFARLRFPNQDRPDVIKTSMDMRVNFAFNWLRNNSIRSEQVRRVTEEIYGLSMRLNQANTFNGFYSIEQNKRVFGFFSYSGPTLDERVSTIVCLTEIQGKLFQGVYICPTSIYSSWEKIAKEALLSISET